jgi:hypothetical protein
MMKEGNSDVMRPRKAESVVKRPTVGITQDWLAVIVKATITPSETSVHKLLVVVIDTREIGMQT